jgi:hypothetical protein
MEKNRRLAPFKLPSAVWAADHHDAYSCGRLSKYTSQQHIIFNTESNIINHKQYKVQQVSEHVRASHSHSWSRPQFYTDIQYTDRRWRPQQILQSQILIILLIHKQIHRSCKIIPNISNTQTVFIGRSKYYALRNSVIFTIHKTCSLSIQMSQSQTQHFQYIYSVH